LLELHRCRHAIEQIRQNGKEVYIGPAIDWTTFRDRLEEVADPAEDREQSE